MLSLWATRDVLRKPRCSVNSGVLVLSQGGPLLLLSPEHVHHPEDPLDPGLPQSQATTSLPCLNLPAGGIPWTWDHTPCGLWSLALSMMFWAVVRYAVAGTGRPSL